MLAGFLNSAPQADLDEGLWEQIQPLGEPSTKTGRLISMKRTLAFPLTALRYSLHHAPTPVQRPANPTALGLR